ncbi:MAG: DUF4244 domain-containing protein [Cellulomonadaceae bacterium]
MTKDDSTPAASGARSSGATTLVLVPGGAAEEGRSSLETGGVLVARWRDVQQRAEAGLATAEYAIATVAAAGFAGLLIAVLRSNAVRDMLTSIVRSALSL